MKQTDAKTRRDLEQKKVVEGVLDGEPILRLSKNLGMSRNKIYRLLYAPSAQDILTTAYYESLDVITYHLPRLISKSIDVLDEAMTHPRRVDMKSIIAARTTLEQFHRLEKLIQRQDSQTAPLVQTTKE